MVVPIRLLYARLRRTYGKRTDSVASMDLLGFMILVTVPFPVFRRAFPDNKVVLVVAFKAPSVRWRLITSCSVRVTTHLHVLVTDGHWVFTLTHHTYLVCVLQ